MISPRLRPYRSLLNVVVLTFCFALWASAGHGLGLGVVSRPVVPDSIQAAFDVRYETDHTVVLACGKQGTMRLGTNGQDTSPLLLIPASGERSLWSSHFLGLSQQFFAGAGPLFQVVWMSRDSSKHWGQMAVDSPVSIDVWKDRLLLVGFRKGSDHKGLPDNSIAWLGSLSKDLADLRPVAYVAKTGSFNPMGLWALVGAGKGRFLRDGSFVIVPGVESGVFLYNQDGRLVRTWESTHLGLDLGCDDSADHGLLVASQMAARAAFVNARRLVDEILPLAQGPALLIRRVEGNEVRWAVKLLGTDGSVTEMGDLPVRVNSPNWHVRGDVLGDRVMLLLHDFPAKDRKVFGHPRLVELEVTP